MPARYTVTKTISFIMPLPYIFGICRKFILIAEKKAANVRIRIGAISANGRISFKPIYLETKDALMIDATQA